MSQQTLLVVVVLFTLFYAWYSTNKLSKQVLCLFNRINKQQIEKFVPLTARSVIFDNKQFTIMPERFRLRRWNKGIHSIFTTWVFVAEFSWNQPYQLDPDDYKNTVETPDVRRLINQEDKFRSLLRSFQAQSGVKKQGILEKYGVLIAIGLVLAVGFYFYQSNQAFAAHLAAIDGKIATIVKP